jgi:hypothetical protein
MGRKTEGWFVRPDGTEQYLRSGYEGPAASTRLPGMDGYIRTHVEAHSAALMRKEGLMRATLYINRIPCEYPNGHGGCNVKLPEMLPPDAELKVIGPGGVTKTYVGLPDNPKKPLHF